MTAGQFFAIFLAETMTNSRNCRKLLLERFENSMEAKSKEEDSVGNCEGEGSNPSLTWKAHQKDTSLPSVSSSKFKRKNDKTRSRSELTKNQNKKKQRRQKSARRPTTNLRQNLSEKAKTIPGWKFPTETLGLLYYLSSLAVFSMSLSENMRMFQILNLVVAGEMSFA